LLFGAPQGPRRQHRKVGVGMGVRWMQLAAQFFHEDPHRVAHIRNHGVYEARHEAYIIAATAPERLPDEAPAPTGLAAIRQPACCAVRESSLESGQPVQSGRSAAW